MLNQLLQNLRNHLNKSKQVNLITPDNSFFEVTPEHDKSYENILLLSSFTLVLALGSLTYLNYLKNVEIDATNQRVKNLNLASNVEINTEEINNKIQNLTSLKEIKDNRLVFQNFFYYLAEISKISETRFVNVSYFIDNKKVSYELTLNTRNQNFETELNEVIKKTFIKESPVKEQEINVEEPDLKQYKYKGLYEL